LEVGDRVRVQHQFRSEATGVVVRVVDGGFVLRLDAACRTLLNEYEAGYELVYNWMRVQGLERE